MLTPLVLQHVWVELVKLHSKPCLLSYPKSGRTWLRVMLDKFEDTSKLYSYTHEPCNQKDVIYLERNPLDVAVSMHFQKTYRAGWGNVSSSEMFESVKKELNDVIGFYKQIDHVKKDSWLMLSYEELHKGVDPLIAAFNYIGKEIDLESAQQIYNECTFNNMKNFYKLSEYDHKGYRLRPGNIYANEPDAYKVRKGKVKGYVDYFNEQQIKQLKNIVRDQYGNRILDRMRSM